MNKRLSALFAAPGTWLKNKLHNDPFFVARLNIFWLYFVAVTLITISKGVVTDHSLHTQVYAIAVSQNGQPVEDAFASAIRNLWFERIAFLGVFGVAVFFITDLVLRPIKKSAEIQKRFVSIVSHELRTPLTIMKSATEVALRKPATLTQEKAVEVLSSNLEEIERMSETIDYLLAFSVLKNNTQALSLQQLSMTKLAREVVGIARRRYQDKGVDVSIEADGPGVVAGDPSALRGLLYNLVENSILHTDTTGKVRVTISEVGTGVTISVIDTGSGIDPQDLPYIFEPFYRGSLERSSRVSRAHMGLGLSLVKDIADLHGASVRAYSKPGQGTHVTLTFPV